MESQDPGYGQGVPPLPPSHYNSLMPLGAPPPPASGPLALSSTDVKYNLYDTSVNESKPFHDVNGMLQQIMSIVDQSLDEAERFDRISSLVLFEENTHLIKAD